MCVCVRMRVVSYRGGLRAGSAACRDPRVCFRLLASQRACASAHAAPHMLHASWAWPVWEHTMAMQWRLFPACAAQSALPSQRGRADQAGQQATQPLQMPGPPSLSGGAGAVSSAPVPLPGPLPLAQPSAMALAQRLFSTAPTALPATCHPTRPSPSASVVRRCRPVPPQHHAQACRWVRWALPRHLS